MRGPSGLRGQLPEDHYHNGLLSEGFCPEVSGKVSGIQTTDGTGIDVLWFTDSRRVLTGEERRVSCHRVERTRAALLPTSS